MKIQKTNRLFKMLMSSMMMTTLVVVNLVGVNNTFASDNTPPDTSPIELSSKVKHAIDKLKQTKRKHWSYEISRYKNEEGDITSSIERYQPNSTAQSPWSLHRINGQAPSKKQREKFIKNKLEQKKKKSEGTGYNVSLSEIIQLDTLAFAKESTHYFEMNFDVFVDRFGDKASSKLKGSLLYNKQQQFIETLTITNKEAFSPMFSATLDEFKLSFAFTQINEQVLPTRQDMTMKGTFALFKEIDEVAHTIFSSYQYLPSTN
jgi:hypothetical protein